MKTPAFPQRRILVVDDEPLVCDAVKMMLDFDGHLVKTAGNGKEALAIFEQEPFDLVITDFEMPAMKGDELAAAIKARVPQATGRDDYGLCGDAASIRESAHGR